MNYNSVSLRSQSLPCITFTWRIWNQPRPATFFKLRKTLLEEYQASFSGRELTVTSNILEEDKNQVITQENLLHRNTLDQILRHFLQTKLNQHFPSPRGPIKVKYNASFQSKLHHIMLRQLSRPEGVCFLYEGQTFLYVVKSEAANTNNISY